MLGLAAQGRQRAGNGTQQDSLDDDAFERFSFRQKLGDTTSTRVEVAAPQPAGGGVAHEISVGWVTVRRESTLDDGHPIVPAVQNETRPVAVIIPLLPRIALRIFARCLASRPPRSGQRKSLFDRNSECAAPTFPECRTAGIEAKAKTSRSHPLMSVKRNLFLMTPATSGRVL